MPAFADNYIHIGLRDGRALVVDPGAAQPVFDSLADAGAILDSILITHKHADHIGGLGEIVSRHPDLAVFGPRAAPGINRPLREGDTAATFAGQVVWQTIATPGHTADHLSFYCEKEQVLLSGDTLFAGGCGRLFEGDAATMRASLQKLAALPDEVRVYCGHEYTLANLRFARAVEPDNDALRARAQECEAARAEGRPTLPSTIGIEKATNPFLRENTPTVAAAARKHAGRDLDSADEVFAVLRAWKDRF